MSVNFLNTQSDSERKYGLSIMVTNFIEQCTCWQVFWESDSEMAHVLLFRWSWEVLKWSKKMSWWSKQSPTLVMHWSTRRKSKQMYSIREAPRHLRVIGTREKEDLRRAHANWVATKMVWKRSREAIIPMHALKLDILYSNGWLISFLAEY